jgi:hypothetical protein
MFIELLQVAYRALDGVEHGAKVGVGRFGLLVDGELGALQDLDVVLHAAGEYLIVLPGDLLTLIAEQLLKPADGGGDVVERLQSCGGWVGDLHSM